MKFLTYVEDNKNKVGVKVDEGIVSLEKVYEDKSDFSNNMIDVIRKRDQVVSDLENIANSNQAMDYILGEKDISYGSCIYPGKIICVGLNYRKHAEETNAPIPESPILFNKFNNGIAAHMDVITLPKTSNEVDYEAELGIVIGKKTKDISETDALNHVFGYCAVNDLSARDLQMKTPQWMLGKISDGFCPVGPYLVTTDEIKNPNNLFIKSYVNGELKQNSNTSDMIFSCAEIVSYISKYMTLEPGDLILTGTPEGVVLGLPEEERVWLKDNDEVVIEIEGLGMLINTMKQE